MNAKQFREFISRKRQKAGARYNDVFANTDANTMYRAATGPEPERNTNKHWEWVMRANALTDAALALSGDPAYRILDNKWTEEEVAFLSLFMEGGD